MRELCMYKKWLQVAGLSTVLSFAGGVTSVFADGTEILGAPSIDIAEGTDLVAAGIGLNEAQPGDILITIPADHMVKQVLLYWEGRWDSSIPATEPGATDTIIVDGMNVIGTKIGGPTPFVPYKSFAYRADISDIVDLVAGLNSVTISGLNFDHTNDGAGILAIIDDGENTGMIDIRDGNDYAFLLNGRPLQVQTTEPQTFSFDSMDVAREAKVWIFAADVGVVDGTARPNAIDVTVDGNTSTLINPLFSSDGPQWDTLMLEVPIPAGASDLTLELLSIDDNSGLVPASIAWVMGGMTLKEKKKCVHSKCYFKLHSKCGPLKRNPVWDLLGPKAEDTPFFNSGKTWCQMLYSRSSYCDAYGILARQYITAILNKLCGTNTAVIDYKLELAEKLLKRGYVGRRGIYVAYYLYKYNKGYIGPGACKCRKAYSGCRTRVCEYKRCCSNSYCSYNKCSYYKCYRYKKCYQYRPTKCTQLVGINHN